jgi:CDP-diacylglycerol--glycerol-3-phosphate 3-phosphatidyltransferase
LILFLGILVYYARVNRFMYAVLAGAAMAGSVMVSYAKARAESLVPKAEVGFWDRPERLALMILAAIANRMPIALWILAIGPNLTVIHRILHTWKQTKDGQLPLAGSESHAGASASHTKPQISIPAVQSRNTSPPILTRAAKRGS